MEPIYTKEAPPICPSTFAAVVVCGLLGFAALGAIVLNWSELVALVKGLL